MPIPGWWIAAACAVAPDADRQAWLVDALVDDNRPWLSRDPALLADKFDKMADDRFDFLRGTAGVWYRDLARPGTDRAPTAFARDPATWEVLVVGDPHLENVGAMLPGPGPGPVVPVGAPLVLAFNDLDAAGFGPYGYDARRAALSLAVVLDDAGCDAACRAPALEAVAGGYVDEWAAPGFVPALVPGRGVALDRFLADLSEEGADRARLVESSEPTASGRRFWLDPAVDAGGDGLIRPTPDEDAQADRLLASGRWPAGFRVLDVARRFGVGVASLPAVRYLVAWDTGDPGPADDDLLSIREVVDPPVLPNPSGHPAPRFDGPADRIVATTARLATRPDDDVLAQALVDGGQTFKVQTWSSWFQSLDHAKLVRDLSDGTCTPDDLAALGAQLGAQLADAHRRGSPDAAAAIAGDLAGRRDAFIAERVRDAERDLGALDRDHRLFVDALDALGPVLGAETR